MRSAIPLGAVAVLAVALALSGCGDQPGGSGRDLDGDLDGRTFLTTTVTEDGVERDLVAGTELRLRFAEGGLSAHAGCNHLHGDYELSAGELRVGPIGGTEMGCPGELMEQDDWVRGFFAGPVEIAVSDQILTLTSGGTVLTLTDRVTASPDVPLVGTAWELTTLVEGDIASSLPTGVTAGIELDDDGRVQVDTGCNRGSGTVEPGGDGFGASRGTLTFGPVSTTRIGCPRDRMSVERAVLAVLDGEVEYAVEERSLTLASGDRALVFAAAP